MIKAAFSLAISMFDKQDKRHILLIIVSALSLKFLLFILGKRKVNWRQAFVRHKTKLHALRWDISIKDILIYFNQYLLSLCNCRLLDTYCCLTYV